MKASRVRIVVGAVAVAGLLAGCTPWWPGATGVASEAPGRSTVTISGTAYRFNSRSTIAGATIKVAEQPGVETTTAADGTYEIEVPKGRKATPYIEAVGYHSIHLQTFVPASTDLREVNFQTPTEDIFQALRAYVGAALGHEIDADKCIVVSTISDPRVHDMTFDEFIQFAPHGVAGATATAAPSMGQPIYFNESVLPDPTRTESSDDGGVLWVEVPDGTYHVQASHPEVDFASFRATCAPGRLVNANPVWGLYGL